MPVALQLSSVGVLAGMRQSCFNFTGKRRSNIDPDIRCLSSKEPDFGYSVSLQALLVDLLSKSERIPSTGENGIKCGACHSTIIRKQTIGRNWIVSDYKVRAMIADLMYKLTA